MMMSETANLKLPIRTVELYGVRDGCGYIHDADNNEISAYGTIDRTAAENKAFAALIVTAVNAFEPMKAAAKQIVENLELLEGEMSAYRTNPADEDELIITVGDARALRAALRLAEGEKEASGT
jgi:hypothetical protein